MIEADSIAGDSDLMCQAVSTGPENLEEAIQRILAVPGLIAAEPKPSLRRRTPRRLQPLIAKLGAAFE